jgi:integrase
MMRKTRYVGMFQRCPAECGARCQRHRYWFHVELTPGPLRRRRQVTKGGFATAKQAERARANVIEQFRAGRWPEHPMLTVGEWLQAWYKAKIEAGTIRPTTARCYRQHLDDYLLPRLGGIRLSRLRGGDITAMYQVIRDEHAKAIKQADRERVAAREYAKATGTVPLRVPKPREFNASSVVRLHATLHAALNAAVRAGEIATNPAKQAEVPRRKPAKVRPWTPETYGQFLDYLDLAQDPMAALFWIAGHLGLRRGELCGLRWDDVDFAQRVLVVRRQLTEVDGRVTIGRAKTRTGEDRVIDFDAGTAHVLWCWRRRQRHEHVQAGLVLSGYVFTNPAGDHWYPRYVSYRFSMLTKAAGVPKCRLHDLRHLAASLQLAAGVDIAIVSKRLGHSTFGITADTYCHLLPGVGADAGEAAAALVPHNGIAHVP